MLTLNSLAVSLQTSKRNIIHWGIVCKKFFSGAPEFTLVVSGVRSTEYGTALTTILPILFLYLNTVTVTAGTFEP